MSTLRDLVSSANKGFCIALALSVPITIQMAHIATEITKKRLFDGLAKEIQAPPPLDFPAQFQLLAELPLCPLPKYSERERLHEEGAVITSRADSINDIIYLVLLVWMFYSLFSRVLTDAINRWKPELWNYEIVKLLPDRREALRRIRRGATLYRLPTVTHACSVLLLTVHFLSRWLRQTSRLQIAFDVQKQSLNVLQLLLSMALLLTAVGVRAATLPLAMDFGVLGSSLAVLAAIDFLKTSQTQLTFLTAFPYASVIALTIKCFLVLHTLLTVLSQKSSQKMNLKLFAFLKVAKINVVVLHTVASTSLLRQELVKGCTNGDVRPLWFKVLDMWFFFIMHDVFLGAEEELLPETSPTEMTAPNGVDGKRKKND